MPRLLCESNHRPPSGKCKGTHSFHNWGLLTEALEAIVRGELEVAKVLLRDYINATVGFEAVGKAIDKSPKSLMRMLGQDGNPNARSSLTELQRRQA